MEDMVSPDGSAGGDFGPASLRGGTKTWSAGKRVHANSVIPNSGRRVVGLDVRSWVSLAGHCLMSIYRYRYTVYALRSPLHSPRRFSPRFQSYWY